MLSLRRLLPSALALALTVGAVAAPAAVGDPATSAAAATTDRYVTLPDLASVQRLSNGGMNIWRTPLSNWEAGTGKPVLVKSLNFGGFSYDRSHTLAGDFGNITTADDDTADHVVWHAQPNGGVLLWAVAGGGDTNPRLWADLRTGGWSWADSTPLVADVTGDTYDDLVVVHRNGAGYNAWVFASTGTGLNTTPQLWQQVPSGGYTGLRFLLGDLDGDGKADLVRVRPTDTSVTAGLRAHGFVSTGTRFSGASVLLADHTTGGWSFKNSRQLLGDVNGDGLADLVHIHAQTNNPGMLVWGQRTVVSSTGALSSTAPAIWQDLRTGGWSFAGSRQQLADVNGDFADDLITVHAQNNGAGYLVWRHHSTKTALSTPTVLADMRTGGWTYRNSREDVALFFGKVVA